MCIVSLSLRIDTAPRMLHLVRNKAGMKIPLNSAYLQCFHISSFLNQHTYLWTRQWHTALSSGHSWSNTIWFIFVRQLYFKRNTSSFSNNSGSLYIQQSMIHIILLHVLYRRRQSITSIVNFVTCSTKFVKNGQVIVLLFALGIDFKEESASKLLCPVMKTAVYTSVLMDFWKRSLKKDSNDHERHWSPTWCSQNSR